MHCKLPRAIIFDSTVGFSRSIPFQKQEVKIFLGVSWSIHFEAAALKGQKKCGSWHPWKDLDFLFLKRYESWKSNNRIKSYGSRKFVMHRSVRHPGFCDISAVLTPISTHEYCWNVNLKIFAMALVLTCFDSRVKIKVFGPTRDRLWIKLGQSCYQSC